MEIFSLLTSCVLLYSVCWLWKIKKNPLTLLLLFCCLIKTQKKIICLRSSLCVPHHLKFCVVENICYLRKIQFETKWNELKDYENCDLSAANKNISFIILSVELSKDVNFFTFVCCDDHKWYVERNREHKSMPNWSRLLVQIIFYHSNVYNNWK